MKINWKLRFGNKVVLTTLIGAIVALVYQVLGLFGVVPTISESEIVNVAGMVLNVLTLLGIITDPTTTGVSDSDQAMGYNVPKA